MDMSFEFASLLMIWSSLESIEFLESPSVLPLSM